MFTYAWWDSRVVHEDLDLSPEDSLGLFPELVPIILGGDVALGKVNSEIKTKLEMYVVEARLLILSL
jgi:hypothetical protein